MRILARIGWLAVGCLALGSLALAMTRIYQVDEAQNVYMARVTWLGLSRELFTSNALHLFPLGALSAWASDSAAIFRLARGLLLGVFWLNTWLLARATEVRGERAPFAFVLLAAATLAPMWDYGFEIRHENLLLTGLLAIWVLGQRTSIALRQRMVLLGAAPVLLAFTTAKALVFAFPMAAWLVLMPANAGGEPLARRLKYFALGAALGFVAVRVVYELIGAWPAFIWGMREVAKVSAARSSSGHIVSGLETLARLVPQAPLMLATCAAGCLAIAIHVAKRRSMAALFSAGASEVVMLALAVAVFFINPTPFPYNLVLLVPFAFLVGLRWVRWLADELSPRAWRLVLLALCAAHVGPFAAATPRHFTITNARQELLMHTAEALTDPARDRVYDAIGMVPSRKSIHYWWYLHSLSIQAYGSKAYPTVAAMLQKQPAAVVITSYRTSWIRGEDHRFIADHYVPMASDFWVLGTVATSDKAWTCLHPGRYALLLEASGAEPVSATIDDLPRAAGVLDVAAGAHRIHVTNGRAALIWVGPHLDAPPALPPGAPHRLFVNWY